MRIATLRDSASSDCTGAPEQSEARMAAQDVISAGAMMERVESRCGGKPRPLERVVTAAWPHCHAASASPPESHDGNRSPARSERARALQAIRHAASGHLSHAPAGQEGRRGTGARFAKPRPALPVRRSASRAGARAAGDPPCSVRSNCPAPRRDMRTGARIERAGRAGSNQRKARTCIRAKGTGVERVRTGASGSPHSLFPR